MSIQPDPSQSNPWVNPTHGQLWWAAKRFCACLSCPLFNFSERHLSRFRRKLNTPTILAHPHTVSISVWSQHSPLWARGRCRISPPRFLAECCKRQLNQDSFVLLYFRLLIVYFSDLYWVYLSVFSCTVLFVSISQVIGCEDRLRNDLYCVEWGVN